MNVLKNIMSIMLCAAMACCVLSGCGQTGTRQGNSQAERQPAAMSQGHMSALSILKNQQ